MKKHLERDLERVKKQLLEVEALVEDAVNSAITALTDRRAELVDEIIDNDEVIDSKEVAIEEECLKILALHQPVASDLRFVIGVMKVINGLERMGDQAVNIAERAGSLAKEPALDVPLDYHRMAEVVRSMVRSSLDAQVNQDTDLARKVCLMDDEVDEIHSGMFDILQARMRENPDTVERAVHYLSASRDLERIADLATNIAEDVVFMVEGEVIRHTDLS
ncbi:MAG: phosphate signaling complex protein PhoU [Myxococcota bacterium]|nr:phosphate signaling complex protein PhoU [Myxococcota bacterium]